MIAAFCEASVHASKPGKSQMGNFEQSRDAGLKTRAYEQATSNLKLLQPLTYRFSEHI